MLFFFYSFPCKHSLLKLKTNKLSPKISVKKKYLKISSYQMVFSFQNIHKSIESSKTDLEVEYHTELEMIVFTMCAV